MEETIETLQKKAKKYKLAAQIMLLLLIVFAFFWLMTAQEVIQATEKCNAYWQEQMKQCNGITFTTATTLPPLTDGNELNGW